MKLFDSFKFRKHPGDLRSRTMMLLLKIMLIIGLVSASFEIVLTITGMGTEKLSIPVRSPRHIFIPEYHYPPGLNNTYLEGQYEFKPRNVFDWLLANQNGRNILPSIVRALIYYYGLRLCMVLTLKQPFSFNAKKYISAVGLLFISGYLMTSK